MVTSHIGIDLGTSGVKALLIDETGAILAEAATPLAVSRPRPGWSEQDPEAWWQATLTALDQLAKAAPHAMARAVSLGLSGQMHGAVVLDADLTVLRPAILWNDGRSSAECAELEAACPDLHAITGNLAMPGFTAPKIAWLRKHEPDIYARIDKVLLPKDFLRLRLTGELFSDMSDAAGTLWLDVGRRGWSDAMLSATGLTQSAMPSLVEGSAATAALKPALTARWGIAGPVVVAGGGGDNAASACGIGAVRPGEGFVSLGTSGVLFVCNDRFEPNTAGAVHTFCHAIPGTWHQMGVILSATDSLNWLAGVTGQTAGALSEAAAARFSGPGSEIFLPYLSGERTPHNNAGARGSFAGLSHKSDPASLAQAVMEGVAFALRDCQRVLADAGTRADHLLAVGGGSRSPLWLKLLATNLDMPIAVPVDGDFGAAFGAARLGLCAYGNADPRGICVRPRIKTVVEPDRALGAAYADHYARYRALYPAIEEALQ